MDAGIDVRWFISGYGSPDIERTVRENMEKDGAEKCDYIWYERQSASLHQGV